MSFSFSRRSRDNLTGVHPDLIRIASLALTVSPLDFVVIEGRRTHERQKQLVRAGASRTYQSKHLTGHAIDVAAWVDGEIRWDWPLYPILGSAFKSSAASLGATFVWGGDWPRLRDGPHMEISPLAHPWPRPVA